MATKCGAQSIVGFGVYLTCGEGGHQCDKCKLLDVKMAIARALEVPVYPGHQSEAINEMREILNEAINQ